VRSLHRLKVTEQIDRSKRRRSTLTDYWRRLRIMACILMLPLLTLAADACGVFMGWVTQTIGCPGFAAPVYQQRTFSGATFKQLCSADIQDDAVFGLIVGLIACFQGMRTRGGAEGVGRQQQIQSSCLLFLLFWPMWCW